MARLIAKILVSLAVLAPAAFAAGQAAEPTASYTSSPTRTTRNSGA